MTLAPGTRVGPYEIVALLGAGGMGVVYRAVDTRLHRPVAIKFLKAEYTDRFEREARAVSAISHPNIATLYEVGSHAGDPYLVMELVEGQPLRAPLPIREALTIAIQIADAMAAAHAAGIVHRDLKPANISVTPRGTVKVLDFGLAKAARPGPGPADHTRSVEAQTAEGSVVGTVAYMSPEQAEGKAVDHRSDIFSFGAVLYEMVSGRRAFAGSSAISTLSAILHQDPPPLPGVPRDLQKLIERCLRKDPDRRIQHMDDVRVLLRELEVDAAGPEAAVVPSRWAAPLRAGAAAILVFAAGAAAVHLWRGTMPAADRPLRKYSLMLDADAGSRGGYDTTRRPVLSPDGAMVAYTKGGRIWIRHLSQLAPREYPGTDGAIGPFWSPDSQHVAFASSDMVKRLSVSSGAVTSISRLPVSATFTGGSWSTAGSILVGFASRGLYEVPASGGEFKLVLSPDRSKGEWDFHTPHYLPDGRSFLFTLHPAESGRYSIHVRSGGTTRSLIESGSAVPACAVYDPRGYVVYERIQRGKSILAAPLSLDSLTLSAEPFVVAEDAGGPSVSDDGTLLHIRGGSASAQELVVLDRRGQTVLAVDEPFDQIRRPAVSPDGTRIAFSGIRDGNYDIWTYDLSRTILSRVTTSPLGDDKPAWSAGGDRLVFQSGSFGASRLAVVPADGSREPSWLTTGGRDHTDPDWVPGGRQLIYRSMREGTMDEPEVWLQDVGGSDARVILSAAANPSLPQVSPDGRWLAYVSPESGREEVYVRPFPDGGSRWQVSISGGTLPRWGRRGDELFYVEHDTLVVVPVGATGGFRAGAPLRLFSGEAVGVLLYSFGTTTSAYDVSPDGQRVVAVRSAGGQDRETAVVVDNWLREFRTPR